jgi:hypothetical protein
MSLLNIKSIGYIIVYLLSSRIPSNIDPILFYTLVSFNVFKSCDTAETINTGNIVEVMSRNTENTNENDSVILEKSIYIKYYISN